MIRATVVGNKDVDGIPRRTSLPRRPETTHRDAQSRRGRVRIERLVAKGPRGGLASNPVDRRRDLRRTPLASASRVVEPDVHQVLHPPVIHLNDVRDRVAVQIPDRRRRREHRVVVDVRRVRRE